MINITANLNNIYYSKHGVPFSIQYWNNISNQWQNITTTWN